MSDYSEIKGTTISTVASDPANPVNGQLWYNSTTGDLKQAETTSAAWSSGGNMGAAIYHHAGFGTQTAAVMAGGHTYLAYDYRANTEEYDGTSWTAGGNLSTGRRSPSGAGTLTSGLVVSGSTGTVGQGGIGTPTTSTEEYDGTSWTAGGTITLESSTGATPRATGASQTSAIAVGGDDSSGGPGVYLCSNKTQHYDGTSWTAGGNLSTGRKYHQVMGTETDGLAAGGGTGFYSSDAITSTEEYDGSSWSSGGNLNDYKRFNAESGISTSSGAWTGGARDAQNSGGPTDGAVETYNGTSWSIGPTMSQHRGNAAGAGNYAAGLVAAGNIYDSPGPGQYITGNTATSEELTGGGTSIRTI
jgi:hypothetical protein